MRRNGFGELFEHDGLLLTEWPCAWIAPIPIFRKNVYIACVHRQTVFSPDELLGIGNILPAEPEGQYRLLSDLLVLRESVGPTFPDNALRGFYIQDISIASDLVLLQQP